MNFATSRFSRLLSFESDRAAESTSDDAPPVSDAPRWTSAMLAATCEVPSAARWTLREISWVAAPCSSTAEAIADEISKRAPSCRPGACIGMRGLEPDCADSAQSFEGVRFSRLPWRLDWAPIASWLRTSRARFVSRGIQFRPAFDQEPR